MRAALILLPALFVALAPLWPARAQQSAPPNPLFDAVSAYGGLQNDVTALSVAGLNSAGDVDEALSRAARHEAVRTARGFVAYGALVAAQSPAFAAGVRSRVRAANRAAVLRRLAADLTYARNRPPGSAEAIHLILRAAQADAARMNAAGAVFMAHGHALQNEAWANIGESRDSRDVLLRTFSAGADAPAALRARLHIAPESAPVLSDPRAIGGPRFWDSGDGAEPPAARANLTRMDTIDRMLTLGALHILGATAAPAQRADALLSDAETASCLHLAQLQFRQCASVTQYPYEDAFCLARHGLEEPAQCFAALARDPA